MTQAGIAIPNPADLVAYVNHYPGMLRPLVLISAQVAGAFPRDASLSLELHRDREIDDEYLALYVRQRDYAPDILDRIEHLSAELQPLLDALGTNDGRLLVITDFQPSPLIRRSGRPSPDQFPPLAFR